MSHHEHEWIPIGYERIPEWAVDDRPTSPGNARLPSRMPDKTYIIRACRDCDDVWVQEFDFAEAATA